MASSSYAIEARVRLCGLSRLPGSTLQGGKPPEISSQIVGNLDHKSGKTTQTGVIRRAEENLKTLNSFAFASVCLA
jgi:hypothetical protein